MINKPSITHNSPYNALERALFILQDGIAIIDSCGKIVYINRAAQLIFKRQIQYQPQIGEEFLFYINEERKEMTRASIEAAFKNESTIYDLYYPQDDKETWFEIGYYPIPDEEGTISHVCMRAKDITEKVLLERKLERQRQIQKNRIIKAALDAQERERSEIGRELHDNVNQVLTTVKLYNEICLTEEKTNKAILMKSVQQINFCIETIRSLSKQLATPIVAEMDLKESIKDLVDSMNATRKLTANFYSFGIKNERINQEIQTGLYRIAQEQLTNVLKYANADCVEIMLVGTTNSVALRIQDNGIGFDFAQKRKGVGITNMISRAESLGGTIEFETNPGEGCRMMVELPI
jgi:PAS domain S-box-containing protein